MTHGRSSGHVKYTAWICETLPHLTHVDVFELILLSSSPGIFTGYAFIYNIQLRLWERQRGHGSVFHLDVH